MHIETAWHKAFPKAHIGVLQVCGVDNTQSDLLEPHKRDLEQHLRQLYRQKTRAELLELPVLAAYKHYFKRFDKTYHVQLQLESVVHKEKSLPRVNPLVDAYFMAELETHVLVAGFDADLLQSPRVMVADGVQTLLQTSGKTQTLKAGDMLLLDGERAICSVLYGQEAASLIAPITQNALFVTFAPEAVPAQAVQDLLETIVRHVQVFAPNAQIERLEVLP
jgi:DNA/RNA-binding domain of Phe-tRNA-synthetase-like protein